MFQKFYKDIKEVLRAALFSLVSALFGNCQKRPTVSGIRHKTQTVLQAQVASWSCVQHMRSNVLLTTPVATIVSYHVKKIQEESHLAHTLEQKLELHEKKSSRPFQDLDKFEPKEMTPPSRVLTASELVRDRNAWCKHTDKGRYEESTSLHFASLRKEWNLQKHQLEVKNSIKILR